MSGGLPPRTAVSTFCSVSSLFTYSESTFWPGWACSYTETRCVNVLASAPVQPSQIWIVVPPLLDPPLLSVPQPASTRTAATGTASRPANVTRQRWAGRCIAIPHPAC